MYRKSAPRGAHVVVRNVVKHTLHERSFLNEVSGNRLLKQ